MSPCLKLPTYFFSRFFNQDYYHTEKKRKKVYHHTGFWLINQTLISFYHNTKHDPIDIIPYFMNINTMNSFISTIPL